MSGSPTSFAGNLERFSGFAALYDRYRPQAPVVLVDILTQLANGSPPKLVVDIGSGTGISTVLWGDRAEAIVGIEPNADMRAQAEAQLAARPGAGTIRYSAGTSTATGLPDACADIVTVSQALHWMEPEPTFAEIARILRPGGVFAAYDCDWPPTTHWEVDAAYEACFARTYPLEQERNIASTVYRWPKEQHLPRMAQSGQFRYVKELVVHHQEMGNAERLVGVARSQGGLVALLKAGVSEEELGLTELQRVAQRVLGDELSPWYWSYRVRLGIR